MNLQQLESRRVLTLIELFEKAAEQVPADKTHWKPEKKGKSSHEILEHVAGANLAFAALVRGSALPEQAAKAKDRQDIKSETDSYHQAIDSLKSSAKVLSEAIASVPDSQLAVDRQMPWGVTWKMTRLVTAPSAHIAYHWGQLCYLQTLYGDTKDYT
jgi:uncharacterized damage-inducible protein DinB